jgi:hypothetical protein
MSPKSRGRRNSKSKKKSGKPSNVSRRPSAVDQGPLILDMRTGQEPRVYDASDFGGGNPLSATDLQTMVRIAGENVAREHAAEHALEASPRLLSSSGPRQLEQATAELLAAELANPMMHGRRTDTLCHDLIEFTRNRVLSDIAWSNDEWRGPWWLLHGLASIGPRGSGRYAAEQIAAARVPGEEPGWLGLLPGIAVAGDVYELRDKWGLRLGVIAELAYPGGVDPHVYLLDVDASWYIEVLGAGVFDDVAAAEAAWRGSLPAGEAGGKIEPVTDGTLACLYAMAHLDELMSHDELLTEHYRAERRISDVLARYESRWRAAPAFEPDPDEFASWYRIRHGHVPEDGLAGPLAAQWSEGVPPGTGRRVSPRRAAGYYDYFLAWIEADEEDVRKVMPEWIRWVGEKAGAAPEVIDESVAAAVSVSAEPEDE